MLYKFILLVVILLVFVAITYRRESFEGTLFGMRAAELNEANKFLSSMLYFKGEDEDVYLDTYQETHPIDQLNEPLIMNRCIQFVYEGNNGGVDGIMQAMQRDRKCFVSGKISFDYTNFYTLEDTLKKNLLSLYVESNRDGYVPQFYGPCYVLITQYPYVRVLKRDCSVLPKTLQWDSLQGMFSPKPIDDVSGCAEVKNEIARKALRCEMYIIFPAHDIVLKGQQRLVGGFKYKKWEDIRCNMRRLFAYNPDYAPGVFTVNPRSFDEKCQLACLNESDNSYKYACGARNSRGRWPYESIVLGTRKIPTDNREERKHDYANLFMINPARMNLLLNMGSESGLFRDCITPEAIPRNFNTRYGCSGQPRGTVPTTTQVTLKGIAGAEFNIRTDNGNCIVVKNGVLAVDTCGPERNKRWFLEGVRVNGEGEMLYRIAMKVGSRKVYLIREGDAAKVSYTVPRFSLFKPRTDKQLILVGITPSTYRINWTTNEKFCLNVDGSRIFYEPTNRNNKIFSFVPVSDEDLICGEQLSVDTFRSNLQIAREQLAK